MEERFITRNQLNRFSALVTKRINRKRGTWSWKWIEHLLMEEKSPGTVHNLHIYIRPVAEFKEFERRFKFKPRFKYDWFHLKLYQMFQDLSRRFI